MTDVVLLLVIAYLSRPVVANLVSKNQVMNTSFDPFKVVNTYGAFGSVGEGRYEPVVALSEDGTTWREVDLPCKPTNVKRRPCFCAPYHHRLDWNVWFIGFKPHRAMLQRRESWSGLGLGLGSGLGLGLGLGLANPNPNLTLTLPYP